MTKSKNQQNILSPMEERIISTFTFCLPDIKNTPDSDDWLNTRQIAEKCNATIYKSRYSLLKLKEKGLIIQRNVLSKSYWRLSEKNHAE
ncbi:FaeA/PapI family transcriptional regulator [Cedecea sp.]|jgi:hypothetical protein|uniref:FaeA/PapI family transcriptional regulator n=1 Tax=Cedecea sp. TaxID=1970739 RepID=UPI002F40BADD